MPLPIRQPHRIWGDVTEIDDIEWRVTPGLTPYDQSLAEMEARAAAVAAG